MKSMTKQQQADKAGVSLISLYLALSRVISLKPPEITIAPPQYCTFALSSRDNNHF